MAKDRNGKEVSQGDEVECCQDVDQAGFPRGETGVVLLEIPERVVIKVGSLTYAVESRNVVKKGWW